LTPTFVHPTVSTFRGSGPALHPERSLAEHYNPLAMAPELVKAHDALDREVDKAMGAARKLTSERQCQKLLFADYAKLTNN
ncbi:type IIL restriction-modification enzyme MmeI, partial [Bifidobacterium longum]|uniref:type IIL restriction-modification enzyme MmeI n=1 Tax=Bifidobacterium longum TaxID=216816 RepID=UPI0035BC5A21